MTEPATNPTEPTPPAADPTPATSTPPAAGGAPTPAASEPKTLLTDDKPPVTDKPADAKPDEKKPDEAKPAGAPEKYDFKAPEGKEYDPQLLDSFAEAARDADMSQEAAQKFIDKMAPVLATRQAEQYAEVQKQWVDEVKADKDIGGEKLGENLSYAKKFLNTFDTDGQLLKLLDSTGFGNNPHIVRTLIRAGKALSEDTFVAGQKPTGSKDAAAVLYDNTPAKE